MATVTDNGADIHIHSVRSGLVKYVPGFLYVVILYVLGTFFFSDPRATFVIWGAYDLSWVEVLLVVAAMVSIAGQMKVSHPGIDNTTEALTMGAMAVVQLILFLLAAANVTALKIFGNTEFLLLTFISMTQAVVAILINARTLRRTIGIGDNA
jgi:hypothetical protein